jgi:hypothetical protein
MDQIQRDLLTGLLASSGVRADDKHCVALDSLVEQGLCRLDAPDEPFPGSPRPEPIYRLTEKGKLVAGSLVAPFYG